LLYQLSYGTILSSQTLFLFGAAKIAFFIELAISGCDYYDDFRD
jgi:hypothetical protein